MAARSRKLFMAKCLVLLTAPACALMASPDKASATAELDLTSGASTTGVIVGAPCGFGSCVVFNGTVGAWTINLVGGLSAGPGNPLMDLSSLNATTSGTASPLDVVLSDNGFTRANALWGLASSGNLVSGTGSATLSAYLDNGNTDFAKTTLIGTLGPSSAMYATSGTFSASAVPNYALTEDLRLTAGSGGVVWSTDSSVTPVPEPPSLVLMSSALPGLTGLVWLRRRKVTKLSWRC